MPETVSDYTCNQRDFIRHLPRQITLSSKQLRNLNALINKFTIVLIARRFGQNCALELGELHVRVQHLYEGKFARGNGSPELREKSSFPDARLKQPGNESSVINEQ